MAFGPSMRPQPGMGKRRAFQPMSEINVTPMVDVMLVLLVIFMVTAPLLTVGVPVDLPKTKAKVLNESDEPLVISLTAEGKVFLQETETDLRGLVLRLRAITENKADTRIFVRGDKAVAYGRVLELMARVSSAGFSRVALIAKNPSPAFSPEEGKGKKVKKR
jgi:biopolymer transport protein TolR